MRKPTGRRVPMYRRMDHVWSTAPTWTLLHNLWVMPARGGDAFPVGYGDWDQNQSALAPGRHAHRLHLESTGKHGTSISSAYRRRRSGSGNRRSALSFPDGRACILRSRTRDGRAASARIKVTRRGRRFYAPADALVHAATLRRARGRPRRILSHARRRRLDVPAAP